MSDINKDLKKLSTKCDKVTLYTDQGRWVVKASNKHSSIFGTGSTPLKAIKQLKGRIMI